MRIGMMPEIINDEFIRCLKINTCVTILVIRADDLTLNYNHLFTVPGNVMIRPQIGNSFPISFESRLSGFQSIPRASLLVMRNFLDNNLNLYLRGGGSYYISKYKID